MTILGGVEGVAFVNTKYANWTNDWPDIEIHFISSSPSSDGGKYIRRVMGLNDLVSYYIFSDLFGYYRTERDMISTIS